MHFILHLCPRIIQLSVTVDSYLVYYASCRKQLGGKLGTSLQTDLGVDTVGDLLQFSETKLQEHYGINTG